MDKRRGIKGKLAKAFYRTPKSSPTSMQFSSKIKPTLLRSAFIMEDDHFVLPSEKQKPSSFVKESDGDGHVDAGNGRDTISEVDKRAEKYISYVQERFKLERLDDDWRKY